MCERAPQPEAIRFSEAAAAQRRCWEKTNDERKAEKVQANVIIVDAAAGAGALG